MDILDWLKRSPVRTGAILGIGVAATLALFAIFLRDVVLSLQTCQSGNVGVAFRCFYEVDQAKARLPGGIFGLLILGGVWGALLAI